MAHLHKVNGILHKKHPSAYPTKSRIFSHSHSHHKPPITVTTHIPFPPSIYLATYPHPIQYKKTAKSQPAPKPFSFLPPPSTPVSGQGQHKKSTKRRTHPSNAKTGKKCNVSSTLHLCECYADCVHDCPCCSSGGGERRAAASKKRGFGSTGEEVVWWCYGM